MAKIATLVDSFAGDLTLWPGAFGGASIVGRRLQIPEVSSTYAGIASDTGWDITSSSVFAQVTPLPQPGNGSRESYMQVFVAGDTTSWIGFFQSGDSTLYMRRQKTGVNSDTSMTYDPVAHSWWRLRVATSAAYWDTSPDGITWTQRRTMTHGLTLTNVELDFSAGAWATETSDYMYVNNVNVPPSGNFMAFM